MTGCTPEIVESLRRRVIPQEQAETPRAIVELPQELTAPRERQGDDATTLTSNGDIETSFIIPPILEPEDVTAAENVAFGSDFTLVSREEVREENSHSMASRSTIVSSIHTHDNE